MLFFNLVLNNLILLSLLISASSKNIHQATPHRSKNFPFYTYKYNVENDIKNVNFEATEARKDGHTRGSYTVLLPDGRWQKVTYHDHGKGLMAVVAYSKEKNTGPALHHSDVNKSDRGIALHSSDINKREYYGQSLRNSDVHKRNYSGQSIPEIRSSSNLRRQYFDHEPRPKPEAARSRNVLNIKESKYTSLNSKQDISKGKDKRVHLTEGYHQHVSQTAEPRAKFSWFPYKNIKPQFEEGAVKNSPTTFNSPSKILELPTVSIPLPSQRIIPVSGVYQKAPENKKHTSINRLSAQTKLTVPKQAQISLRSKKIFNGVQNSPILVKKEQTINAIGPKSNPQRNIPSQFKAKVKSNKVERVLPRIYRGDEFPRNPSKLGSKDKFEAKPVGVLQAILIQNMKKDPELTSKESDSKLNDRIKFKAKNPVLPTLRNDISEKRIVQISPSRAFHKENVNSDSINKANISSESLAHAIYIAFINDSTVDQPSKLLTNQKTISQQKSPDNDKLLQEPKQIIEKDSPVLNFERKKFNKQTTPPIPLPLVLAPNYLGSFAFSDSAISSNDIISRFPLVLAPHYYDR